MLELILKSFLTAWIWMFPAFIGITLRLAKKLSDKEECERDKVDVWEIVFVTVAGLSVAYALSGWALKYSWLADDFTRRVIAGIGGLFGSYIIMFIDKNKDVFVKKIVKDKTGIDLDQNQNQNPKQ